MSRCQRCNDLLPPNKFQCPSCLKWNTPSAKPQSVEGTVLLSDATEHVAQTISTGPWDDCFSTQGGVVCGSVNLVGGSPGAGKSTLSLQIAGNALSQHDNGTIVYVAAEERIAIIRARAIRLGVRYLERMAMVPHLEGFSGDLGQVLSASNPILVIVDSLAKFIPDPDLAVMFCGEIQTYAAKSNVPILLLDHITKAHDFAGLMSKQHVVDGLFTFNPYEKGADYRELNVVKNRNGPNKQKCFRMTETGLVVCPKCKYCEGG